MNVVAVWFAVLAVAWICIALVLWKTSLVMDEEAEEEGSETVHQEATGDG